MMSVKEVFAGIVLIVCAPSMDHTVNQQKNKQILVTGKIT